MLRPLGEDQQLPLQGCLSFRFFRPGRNGHRCFTTPASFRPIRFGISGVEQFIEETHSQLVKDLHRGLLSFFLSFFFVFSFSLSLALRMGVVIERERERWGVEINNQDSTLKPYGSCQVLKDHPPWKACYWLCGPDCKKNPSRTVGDLF